MAQTDKVNQTPQHIAVIMDGNGRWAHEHHLPRIEGHKRGADNARNIVKGFMKHGIPYITLYVFSTENWDRPSIEIRGLFNLLMEKLDEGILIAQQNNLRIRHLGEVDRLPQKVQEKIEEAITVTQHNTAMTLCLAFNYGGRDEIVQAVRKLVRSGVQEQAIDEQFISQHLYTVGIPDPDLVIRTGGDMRLSNFLLWQSAYAEIYSTPVLWPDFNEEEIQKALVAYSQRQRRFGRVSQK